MPSLELISILLCTRMGSVPLNHVAALVIAFFATALQHISTVETHKNLDVRQMILLTLLWQQRGMQYFHLL